MKDGEKIVQRLSECGKIMASGQFTAYDLDYIEKALKMMLDATEKTKRKNNKKLNPKQPHVCVVCGSLTAGYDFIYCSHECQRAG